MTLLPSDKSLMLFPAGVWIALLSAAIAAAALSYTRFGRHVVAIGSNEQTARLCGVAVERVTVLAYVLAGTLAGLAGVMEFAHADGRRPDRFGRTRARSDRRGGDRRRFAVGRPGLGGRRADRRAACSP